MYWIVLSVKTEISIRFFAGGTHKWNCWTVSGDYVIIINMTESFLHTLRRCSNFKPLGLNYLWIHYRFTVLHKIRLVLMKCHWGDRGEFHDGKQKMSPHQSDNCKERDVCHRHRLHNMTFKGTLSDNISLSSLFRTQRPLLPVVLGGGNAQLAQRQERAIFCSAFNYGGVKHGELTAGHRPSCKQ